jgi:hypothetical protein
MKIIVDKERNIVISHCADAEYVLVLGENYVPCNMANATAIYSKEKNVVYPIYLFSLYEVNDNETIIDGYYEYVNGVLSISASALSTGKANKLNELSTACEEKIYDGIDVKTTQGTEHFSLELNDQINLAARYLEVKSGATAAVYHADPDNNDYRLFTADEIIAIYTAADAFRIYETTYFNKLKKWVNRCTTITDVNAITYGVSLPTDLDTELATLTGKSSISL